MSLIFDKVSLRNFGPYRSITALDLSTDASSPVVVIYGENTMGKTRLFAAIRWCLYGTFVQQQEPSEARPQLRDYFNYKAVDAGETEMAVSLTFRSSGEEYILTRRAVFNERGVAVEADLRIGGTVIPPSEVDAEIGRLMHPRISEFYLFDAELMTRFFERLATERERDLIRESINAVLGIPALQLLENDVRQLAADAQDRQAQATSDANRARKLTVDLEQLRDESKGIERERLELQKDYRRGEEELSSIRDKMAANAGIAADARDQERLEAQINGDESVVSRLKEDMRGILQDGWLGPAAVAMADRLANVRQHTSALVAAQAEVENRARRVAFLEQKTQGGRCPQCEQSLSAITSAEERELEQLKRETAEESSSSEALNRALERERLVGSLIRTEPNSLYIDKQQQLTDLQMIQYQRSRSLRRINDRLQGHSAADIRAMSTRQEYLVKAVASLNRQLGAIPTRLRENARKQQRVLSQMRNLKGATPAMRAEVDFCSFLSALLSHTVERYQERTRESVEEIASRTFLDLIRDAPHYNGLRISRDYSVELLDPRSRSRPTSEGGRQLVALSLIKALRQAAVREGPVILDSPLARLDPQHRLNVLDRWVPSLGDQIVVFVHSGEMDESEARTHLGRLIGREYEIFRPNDDPEHAEIRTVNRV